VTILVRVIFLDGLPSKIRPENGKGRLEAKNNGRWSIENK